MGAVGVVNEITQLHIQKCLKFLNISLRASFSKCELGNYGNFCCTHSKASPLFSLLV